MIPFLGTLGSVWSTTTFTIVFWVLLVWSGVWKGIALWFAGKNKQKVWFIFLFIFNTVGILPIIYIFAFRKDRKQAFSRKSLSKKRKYSQPKRKN